MENIFSSESLTKLTLQDLGDACSRMAIIRGFYIAKDSLKFVTKEEYNVWLVGQKHKASLIELLNHYMAMTNDDLRQIATQQIEVVNLKLTIQEKLKTLEKEKLDKRLAENSEEETDKTKDDAHTETITKIEGELVSCNENLTKANEKIENVNSELVLQ